MWLIVGVPAPNGVLVRRLGVRVVFIFAAFCGEEAIVVPQPFGTGCPASSAYFV